MNFNDLLTWLVGGGAIIAVSWLFERWAWFQSLAAGSKQFLTYGASVVLAVGAWAVVTYVSPAVLAQLAPVFSILITTFVSIFLGQGFHAVDKVTK
jgi:hypothetical protein